MLFGGHYCLSLADYLADSLAFPNAQQDNINLPAALLSRFDLLWLILDRPDLAADKELAKCALPMPHPTHAPALTPANATRQPWLLCSATLDSTALIAICRARSTAIGRHVLHVHRHCAHPAMGFTPLSPADLRAYVALARRKNPHVPRELTE